MGIPFITFFFIFLFSFAKFGESSDRCVRIRCSKNEPVISFPFRIKGRQNEWCGYPGFDLTCNDKNRTVLELPFSSPFYVHHINYGSNSNKIQLHDPDNCLPKRLLDNQLNLSGTPFIHIHNKNYSFYNCSSVRSFNSTSTPMISCLSTSGRPVFATSAANPDSLSLNQNCELIANVQVPVETSDHIASFLQNDIHLTWAWSTSDCKSCNNPKAPSKKHGHGFAYLFIIIGVIAIISFVSFRARVMSNIYRGNHLPHQSGIVNTGLDESTIRSFPMIVLGENRRLPNEANDTTCALCLDEYQPNETLRSLPACNHYFHANCIDKWLRINSRCPVCNTISPLVCETAP
ncbi:hypothetical protein MKW98_017162 [Papaver atlanticum]|uniref:RING-type E3 ubiquitin transferase n=1 Tax=Papaver atlanticum TaxID=357466 RepID=A0AAD4XCB9_9MAGN|nr:hypothetical protein MKW98_017162 [Papaver atlanticum]